MSKSIRDIPKKRGRPKTTGRGEGILLRLHEPLLATLDDWISRQDDRPSRPEAIRRLLQHALITSASHQPTSKATARKAAELAARALDHIIDPSAPPEERATRKRRLIAGPKEFRDIRDDQRKKKG